MEIHDKVIVCDNSSVTDFKFNPIYLNILYPNKIYTVSKIDLTRTYHAFVCNPSHYKDYIQDTEITASDGAKFYCNSAHLKKINIEDEIAIHEAQIIRLKGVKDNVLSFEFLTAAEAKLISDDNNKELISILKDIEISSQNGKYETKASLSFLLIKQLLRLGYKVKQILNTSICIISWKK
ncbi:MAG: hypothetical protein WCP32_10265 [Bacteroidota bacterium]